MKRQSSDVSLCRSAGAGCRGTPVAASAADGSGRLAETFDLLTRLRLLCAGYPGFVCDRGRGVLHIFRQDGQGFVIKVYDLMGPPVVVLGPWCSEVAGEGAVLSLVRKALSGAVRIRIESCRGRDHSWTAEVRNQGDTWAAISQNRIAELWPLHATTVRYLTMPSPFTSRRDEAPADAAVRREPDWNDLAGPCAIPVKPRAGRPAIAAFG